jgi:hypothetical protein
MQLQVKCPNNYCAQIVTVRPEDAGRTARCPSCGGLMAIPRLSGAVAPTQPPSTYTATPPPPSPVSAPPPVPNGSAYSAIIPEPAVEPAPGIGLWTRIEQLSRELGLEPSSKALLGVGLILLALLALTTILPWVSTPMQLGITLASGIVVFLLSVGSGIFLAVSFGLKRRELFTISVLAAAGWGAVAFLWTTSLTAFQFRSHTGLGLFLGLLFAMGVCVVFSYLSYRRLG